MIKVSDLLSKRLITLNSAEIVGTISNIIFDNKLLSGKYLKIYNDDDIDATTKYVELRKVKNLEFDAGVIADKSQVTNEWNTNSNNLAINPINCECFNQDGKSLGFVRDIILDNTSVKTIIVNEKDFSPSNLLSYSDKLLIFNDSGKPIKLNKKSKPSVPKTATGGQTVKIHSFIKSSAANKPAEITDSEVHSARENQVYIKPSSIDITTPSKVPPLGTVTSTPSNQDSLPTAYKFLLNKRIRQEILSDDGSILIKENTCITTETINTARAAGKIVQLALYSE